MANNIETIYKDKKILYESFNVEKAVYVITISWWQETPKDYEDFDNFRFRVLHDKTLDHNHLFFPIVLKTAQNEATSIAKAERKRSKRDRIYTEFQITLRLRKPEIRYYDTKNHNGLEHKFNPLQTFRANTPIVQEQIEKWLDNIFECDYAPVTFLKKKD